MTDTQTITREQLRQAETFQNGHYDIDFKQLDVIDNAPFRDIQVQMELG